MDSKVTVFEVQNDYSVKQHEVALKFPRVSKSRLYIVTNQNTQLHLLNKEGGSIEKSMFRHGVSNKVFTITNTAGTAWEVCMLLSPSEISRLSPNFNIMGFVKSCLMEKNYQDSLSSLCCPNKKHKVDVQELSKAAAQFLSSSEDHIVDDYCKRFNGILTEKLQAFSISQKIGDMVIGALMAVVAAELATSMEGIGRFDYRVEEKEQEDQREQIKKMMNVFDVMVDLLTVTHQGKRVQIIFRNPCPDNWALGGKKPVHSEDTFVFGLCHKVVSISEAESEVQFLQNVQESYDFISVFHLPAFVENLLMTSAWRNNIELFLKKQNERKQIVHELSSMALKFICSKICQQKTFMKLFQREMLKKWSKVEALFVGAEVVCSFGILVAILAAVTAKSIVDRPIPDSEEEVEEELVDPNASSAPSSDVSSSTFLDKSSKSSEVVIGITDDPGMTDGSLKTGEHLTVFPHGTMGIAAVQTADKGDDADKEDPEKPAAKFAGPFASSVLSSAVSSGTFLHNSLNSFEVIITKETDRHGGSKPDLNSSSGDWVKAELESGEVSTCDAKSKISSTHDPEMTDQGSIDGSLKTYDPLADLPGVGPIGEADQEAGNCDDGDDVDENPTSPEVEETIHSQGIGDGPNLDNSNDDVTDRVAQPPSVEALSNALETQDLPFRNRIFKTGFMGLMCLLVVATLINVLPQSVSSALVAIILGLLVLKWLASRQP
ncbi:uncharacterized protein [Dendrobates tinctorius]|uniref:uncharacterized protein n=1 Tax=Dendrobates tinctorius TaxID=92724 RepID=UPI003CCA0DB2